VGHWVEVWFLARILGFDGLALLRFGLKLAAIAILTLIGLHQNPHRLDWYSPGRVLSTDSAIKPVSPVSQPFRRVGNQTAVLSKLRFQVPNPLAKVRHGTTLAPPLRFRRSLQLRNTHFNIFDLDAPDELNRTNVLAVC
jgi:hypothetical protein